MSKNENLYGLDPARQNPRRMCRCRLRCDLRSCLVMACSFVIRSTRCPRMTIHHSGRQGKQVNSTRSLGGDPIDSVADLDRRRWPPIWPIPIFRPDKTLCAIRPHPSQRPQISRRLEHHGLLPQALRLRGVQDSRPARQTPARG